MAQNIGSSGAPLERSRKHRGRRPTWTRSVPPSSFFYLVLHAYLLTFYCPENLYTTAVLLTLVPVSVPDDLTNIRCLRVHLEWIDSRAQRVVPLQQLFQLPSLPLHLRDLLSQLSSRLLIQVLLRDASMAKLYHRSWQQRQQQTVPLINSIAASLRSLLSLSSKQAHLEPLLQQIRLSPTIPSAISLANVLTKLDLSHHSPCVPLSSTVRRAARQCNQFGCTDMPALEFAPDLGDVELGWIVAEHEKFAAASSDDDKDDDEISHISFAPEHDQDESSADSGWTEILQNSANDGCHELTNEVHLQTPSDLNCIESAPCT